MKLPADTGIPSPYPISYWYTHPLPIYEWVKYLASTPYPFHRVWIWGTGMGIQRQRESRSVFRISSIDTRPYYYYYYYLTQYLTDTGFSSLPWDKAYIRWTELVLLLKY